MPAATTARPKTVRAKPVAKSAPKSAPSEVAPRAKKVAASKVAARAKPRVARRAAAKPAVKSAAKTPAKTAAAKKTPARRRAEKPVAAVVAAPVPQLPTPPAGAPPILELCLRTLDEKKAEELVVLDLREKSSIADFFVIATATSEPHLRALRVALEKEFAASGEKIHRSETGTGTGWNVVDAFDVIIHLFLPAQRAACQIETLWETAPRRAARA